MAEAYFRHATEGLPVSVESAGTLDLEPGPALPEAIDAGRDYGLDLSEHRSRCLVGLDFSDADLIIGFEQQHVASAVVDGGAGGTKAFTMAELLRLLRAVDVPTAEGVEKRARSVVEAAGNERMSSNRFVPGEELADPIGQGDAAFKETARAIAMMSDELLVLLFGSTNKALENKEAPRGGLQW